MAESELSIILKLLDQASDKIKETMGGIKQETDKVKKSSDEANKSIREQFKESSRELRMFRREMFLVTAVIATVITSVKEAAQYNNQARESFEKFTVATKTLAGLLGSNLTPALDLITNVIKGFQTTIEAIVAGFIKYFSLVVEFWSNIAKGPIQAFKRAMEVATIATDNFLKKNEETKLVINLYESIKYRLEQYNKELEKQKLLFLDSRITATEYYDYLLQAHVVQMQLRQQEMSYINQLALLRSMMTNSHIEDLRLEIQFLQILQSYNYSTWGSILKTATTTTNIIMQDFTNAVAKMAVEGGKFKDIVNNLWKTIAEAFIAEVERMIAKWMVLMALKGIGGIFGALFHEGGEVEKKHQGGLIRAHSGLAVDEVPIIAQTGEGILSRRGMAALGGVEALNRLNSGRSGDILINISVDNPVISKESDIDYLVETISTRLAREVERIR